MAELMNLPPEYTGDGDIPEARWAVVYRDEREPSLPEYVCMFWESRRENGKSIRENLATLMSFVSADDTPALAVEKARRYCMRNGVPEDNVSFWGVVRKN